MKHLKDTDYKAVVNALAVPIADQTDNTLTFKREDWKAIRARALAIASVCDDALEALIEASPEVI